MGGMASASDNAMRRRKASRQTNYDLMKMLTNDFSDSHNCSPNEKTLYLSVNDTKPSLESFFNFLVRYHHNPIMLHSLIVTQIKYIITILNILTDYDSKLTSIESKKSIFYCRSSYSTKWIMSTYQANIVLTYEQGKRILKVWNDNSTQTLMLLIQKYMNNNIENNKSNFNNNIDINNNNTNSYSYNCNYNDDKHYYDHIKSYLAKEYPIDFDFCQYFMKNVLKFCFNEMTIETHLERKLFLKCLTNNGKFPLTKQSLIIDGYRLSFLI